MKIKKNFHSVTTVAPEVEFKEVFDDKLGELLGTITQKLKPGSLPVVIVNRRVSVLGCPQQNQELLRLTKLGSSSQ